MPGWLNKFFEAARATEIVVMSLVVATACGVWWTVSGESVSGTPSDNSPPAGHGVPQVASAGWTTPSAPIDDETPVPQSSPTTDLQTKPEIDLSQTSWEDPFTAAHWESTGWSFEDRMMQSTGDPPAEAVFRRSYRKLRLDLSLESLGTVGTFEVRIGAPATNAVMTVTFGSGAVVLSADCPKQKGVIRSKALVPEMAAEQLEHLSLIATGNRVRIIRNGHTLLACTQPASQSGRDLTFALISRGAGFRISRLRIEGE